MFMELSEKDTNHFSWYQQPDWYIPPVFAIVAYLIVRLINDTFVASDKPVDVFSRWIEVFGTVGFSYFYQFSIKATVSKLNKNRFERITPYRELAIVILIALFELNVTATPLAAVTDDGLNLTDLILINSVGLPAIVLSYFLIRTTTLQLDTFRLKLELLQTANAKREAELNYLNFQYHPHFLFNALNTLYYLIPKEVDSARRFVLLLSDLMRYQVYQEGKAIPLIDEVKFLKIYIELQRFRLPSKAKIHLRFQEDLADAQIHPLLLMPLLENGFKHLGAEKIIELDLRVEGEYILLELKNSIEEFPESGHKTGVGITHLKQRLYLLYQNNFSYEHFVADDMYIVNLKLPKVGK
jgi:sensor histidine kinase YesM